MKKNIFVLGTGRSGTHWLGYILESSPEIHVNIEVRPIFRWVTQAAINFDKRKFLLPLIIAYYNILPLFVKKHYADKSHPNLWLIDSLVKYVPRSLFIGIIRNPHATVSSMLLHPQVLNWCLSWEKYPIPNEFLGISESNVGVYESLPIEAKCTLRWIAHKNKFDKICKQYKRNILMIDYDRLFSDTENEIDKINKFLDLKKPLPLPNIKRDSKDKWQMNLTKKQIDIINETLKENGFDKYIV